MTMKMILSTVPQSGNILSANPDIPISAEFTITAMMLISSRDFWK